VNLLGEAAAAATYETLVQPLSSSNCGSSNQVAAGAAAVGDTSMSGLAGRVRQLMGQSGQGGAAGSRAGSGSNGGRVLYSSSQGGAAAAAPGSDAGGVGWLESEGGEAPCLY
jgi:hypothetical protein